MVFAGRKVLMLVLVLAAATATACGGQGSASLSPLAPSPTAGGGATISGRVNTAGAPAAAGSFSTMETRGITITVVGTGISTSADNQGQFTLTNVPSGTVQLNFSGAGANATVTLTGVGANDHVQITVTVNGNSGRIESEHHNNGEFEGRIASIDAAGRSFKMSEALVKVPATAIIRHGSRTLQFSDLKVGDHVEVRGTKDGSTITATEIKVENDAEDEHDDHEAGVTELSGAVFGLTGMCPAVTFTVQSAKVTTSNTTRFEHGACTAVRNGVRVEIKGRKQSDGSVAAIRVAVSD